MRIVLDLQACQTSSRFRGIGRYSLSLAKAVARNPGPHEVWLALNGFLGDTVMPLRQAFDGLVPPERILVYSVPGPMAENEPANRWRARASELVREQALADIAPDFVHIASHFEGWIDDAVTSIGALDAGMATAATFYDLIPLKHAETHLGSAPHKEWYLRKLDSLKKAELFLAISDYSRFEAISTLEIPSDRVVNISAGVDEKFRKLQIPETERNELFRRYGIFRPFLLYTGNLDPHKNLQGAIKAFAALSREVRRAHQLVIVSQMDGRNRGKLQKLVKSLGMGESEVILTGFVPESDLVRLYNLCKVFVFPSLYEGFGLPALEAMACGAPTIGSNATSIPEVIGRNDALFDPTSTKSMADAMQQVLMDEGFRESLRVHACSRSSRFSWDAVAQRAVEAMEDKAKTGLSSKRYSLQVTADARYAALLQKIPLFSSALHPADFDLRSLAASISLNDCSQSKRQILVDVSALAVRDAKTGIQRVVRSILGHLLADPPPGFIIEPVYGADCGFYRYAHRFLRGFQGLDHDLGEDFPVDARRGDIFLGLDLSAHLFPVFRPVLENFQRVGVKSCFLVYDLIPVLYPHWFPKGMSAVFSNWLEAVSAHADSLLCISASVADEVRQWLQRKRVDRTDLNIGYFHLGADIDNSVPTRGVPDNAEKELKRLSDSPTFLMVGTIEPRKSHAQVVAAFEKLWASGVEANLVIVGKAGWNMEPFTESLHGHPERGKRLHWMEGISDEYLERVYRISSALIAASEAEGFGLPLIEAAQHKLPVIARDIPVFREVAGEHAFYFNGRSPEELARALRDWMALDQVDSIPRSDSLPWMTWRQSTQQLLAFLLDPIGRQDNKQTDQEDYCHPGVSKVVS
ncbi:MAG: glycosyltransferase family 1 protein [Syntrophotaleaceae bacterium]